MNKTPAPPPPLPRDQEAAHTRLMVELDLHQEDGLRIPCRESQTGLWISTKTSEQREAEENCGACPALRTCRAYALAYNEPTGVWGGMNTNAREQHRKAQNSPTRRQDLMEVRKVA